MTRDRLHAGVAAVPLLLPALVYFGAWAGGLYLPIAAVAMAMLCGAIGSAWIAAAGRLTRPAAVIAAVGFALIISLALATMISGAPIAAWWRIGIRCAAIVAFLACASVRASPEHLIRVAGIAAAVVAMAAVVANASAGWLAPMLTTSSVTGNINTLMATAGPALLALVVLLSGKRESRWWLWALALGGVAALVIAALVTQRRGLAAAWSMGLLAWGCLAVIQRWPRLGWCCAGIVLTLVIAGGCLVLQRDGLTYRGERLTLYRAAWDVAVHFLPYGGGEYAFTRVMEATGEGARHYAATGNRAIHAHNEALDLLMCGGIPAIGLAVVLFGLLGWHWWRMAAGAERSALVASAGAIAVHALTDPAYGSEVGAVWLGAWLGIAFAHAPQDDLPHPGYQLRWMVLPPACVALAIGCTGLGAALLPRNPSPQAALRSVSRCIQPEQVDHRCQRVLRMALAAGDVMLARSALERMKNVLGTTAPVYEGLVMLGEAERDPHAAALAAQHLLSVNPLHLPAYRVWQSDRTTAAVDQRWATRIAWAVVSEDAPLPQLVPPLRRDLDAAADVTLGCWWALHRQPDLEGLLPCLVWLAQNYGDVPAVAQLYVAALADDALGPALSVTQPPCQMLGLLHDGLARTLRERVHSAEAAKRVLEWLRFQPFLRGPVALAGTKEKARGDLMESLARVVELARSAVDR